jgi:hypothetical protein
MKKQSFWILSLVLVGVLVLSACGSKTAEATPSPTPLSVAAISTEAVQTFVAQLTQQAPTITPTPVFTDTPVVTATPPLASASPTRPVPTAVSCANYSFVTDVTIPDGEQLPPGTNFTKTWRVKNSGTCTWTTNFKLVFVRGETMGGQSSSLPSAVTVGQTADISVNLQVPNKTGKLTGIWSLVDEQGKYFGAVLTVVINVGALTPSPTGSLTPTPTLGSESPTPTPTETSTSTS